MKIPRTVWALGAVSLLMDLSSELVHSLLPVLMVTVLGASMLAVGVVEGIAEATASIVKLFSGAISDRLGRRKPIVVLGYGLAALSKPLFPLAASVPLVLGARFMDRVGKGIRGAPRDALIADVTPEGARGAAYGLRQALDTVGAMLGPLAAIALMLALANDVRSVLWWAVVPAVLAVVVLVAFVREPARAVAPLQRPVFKSFHQIGMRTWLVVAVGAVLTLARFSEAFLVLRAQGLGFALAMVPIVLVVMNVAYTATAYPAGVAADRGHRKPSCLGPRRVDCLGSRDCILGFLGTVLRRRRALGPAHGPHAGTAFDAGCRRRARGLARHGFRGVPPRVRVAMLLASVIAGVLWDAYGPAWTFYAGAAFTALALLGLLAVRRSS